MPCWLAEVRGERLIHRKSLLRCRTKGRRKLENRMPSPFTSGGESMRALWRSIAGLTAILAIASAPALAQDVVKIGVVSEFSGPFAQYGQQIVGGMKAYLKQHG